MTKDEIDKLILDNMNFAYYIAHKYKQKVSKYLDFEDLVSICIIGLVKSANTFDNAKNLKFSTYAYKVINNQILQECRKFKALRLTSSLDNNIVELENVIYADLIADEFDLENEVLKNEEIKLLNKFINELPEKIKLIINLKLSGRTQMEVADEIGISQAQVSRLYNKGLRILRNKFEKYT